MENKQIEETKVPDPPKKPLTAFFIYKRDQMDVVRKENNVSKLADITKIISKNWNESKPEVKMLYEKKAAKQKHHYLKVRKEYVEKYGKIHKKPKAEPKRKKASAKPDSDVKDKPDE